MSDEWPAWATERVEIVEWSPAWEQLADELTTDLAERLDHVLTCSVEHVGSTAVRGLPAKPVVDLMASVHSLAAAEDAAGLLGGAGWQLVPPRLDGRPWRRMYVLPEGGRRAAHLHLVEEGHDRWRHALVFRDRLRQSAELQRSYARLKRAAAELQPDDREAYTAAKTAFVQQVVGRSDGAGADPC